MLFQNSSSRSRRRDREPSVWRHLLIGLVSCLVLALFVSAVWYVTRLQSMTIKDVVVQGGETIPHALIETEVEQILRGDYLKVVPHRFSLTYPQGEIAGAIKAIDRVENVSVERKGSTLNVTFNEYNPFALWCLSQEEVSPCFFLDEHGYAFAPSPQLKGGSFIRHSVESEQELVEKQVLDQKSIGDMHALLERLEQELKLRVTHVHHTQEGDVRLSINGGGAVLIRKDTEYESVFENLSSVLASDEFKHLKPGKFQYIDLRFGNKIFVNEEPIPIDEATSTETTATSTLTN